jgi:acetolactate synthase-1/2/3 large subunit
MTGADILLEALKKEGVDTIFGYPGGMLIGLYDKIYDSKIKHVLPRHEQGGAHAAEGYAKATGKVGVCMGTSGPGATNLVTGIADAYMDSVPLVAITGQVLSRLIGGDAFQEADIVGITRPIVKHSYLVYDVTELARTVKEAFHIARTGRPGPVLIDLPKDVLDAQTAFDYPDSVELTGYQPNYEGHPMQVKKVLQALSNAKKPIIIAGGGVVTSGSVDLLVNFAESAGIPVLNTFMGLGTIPATHELYVGWAGMHGNYASNMATCEADYILAIGTRFSDRATGDTKRYAKNATIAQIDIDPTSINKNITVKTPIIGDAKIVLEQFIKYLKKEYKVEKQESARAEWLAQIKAWNAEHPFTYEYSDTIIKPQYVIQQIHSVTNGDAIITTEVGQHQMWTGQFFGFKRPNQFITSGGLGTMGFGLPAAIGAKLGHPDKEVFDISGDGSILMNVQELTTAVQHRLGIKIAILNNHFLGMVRQWQSLFFNNRYSNTCMDCQPDFVKLADAFGGVGFRIDKPSEVTAVLQESLKITDRPVIMDFRCAREENVYPMVPGGKALNEMLLK